uniref:Polyprotein 2 n=2 Tax=Cherry leaf roll virus TaxID=12615 RepID=A0A8F8N4M2_9SECO|nr:polyprotein 2 [Cherry leaf roll virus]
MVRPIVFSNGESVLPKALISEAKMVAAFLKSTRNPAGFWVTFLAQGTSLTPSQVALCAINGLVSRQTVEIHSHGPSAEVFWSALQARLRSFLRAHRQRVTSLLALCCEAYEARDLCRYQRQRAAYLARGAACRAKTLRKKKTALRKERAAQLAQRRLEGERRAAARQAKLARKGQQVLRRKLAALFSPPPPFPTSEWAWEPLPSSPLPVFRDFFPDATLVAKGPSKGVSLLSTLPEGVDSFLPASFPKRLTLQSAQTLTGNYGAFLWRTIYKAVAAQRSFLSAFYNFFLRKKEEVVEVPKCETPIEVDPYVGVDHWGLYSKFLLSTPLSSPTLVGKFHSAGNYQYCSLVRSAEEMDMHFQYPSSQGYGHTPLSSPTLVGKFHSTGNYQYCSLLRAGSEEMDMHLHSLFEECKECQICAGPPSPQFAPLFMQPLNRGRLFLADKPAPRSAGELDMCVHSFFDQCTYPEYASTFLTYTPPTLEDCVRVGKAVHKRAVIAHAALCCWNRLLMVSTTRPLFLQKKVGGLKSPRVATVLAPMDMDVHPLFCGCNECEIDSSHPPLAPTSLTFSGPPTLFVSRPRRSLPPYQGHSLIYTPPKCVHCKGLEEIPTTTAENDAYLTITGKYGVCICGGRRVVSTLAAASTYSYAQRAGWKFLSPNRRYFPISERIHDSQGNWILWKSFDSLYGSLPRDELPRSRIERRGFLRYVVRAPVPQEEEIFMDAPLSLPVQSGIGANVQTIHQQGESSGTAQPAFTGGSRPLGLSDGAAATQAPFRQEARQRWLGRRAQDLESQSDRIRRIADAQGISYESARAAYGAPDEAVPSQAPILPQLDEAYTRKSVIPRFLLGNRASTRAQRTVDVVLSSPSVDTENHTATFYFNPVSQQEIELMRSSGNTMISIDAVEISIDPVGMPGDDTDLTVLVMWCQNSDPQRAILGALSTFVGNGLARCVFYPGLKLMHQHCSATDGRVLKVMVSSTNSTLIGGLPQAQISIGTLRQHIGPGHDRTISRALATAQVQGYNVRAVQQGNATVFAPQGGQVEGTPSTNLQMGAGETLVQTGGTHWKLQRSASSRFVVEGSSRLSGARSMSNLRIDRGNHDGVPNCPLRQHEGHDGDGARGQQQPPINLPLQSRIIPGMHWSAVTPFKCAAEAAENTILARWSLRSIISESGTDAWTKWQRELRTTFLVTGTIAMSVNIMAGTTLGLVCDVFNRSKLLDTFPSTLGQNMPQRVFPLSNPLERNFSFSMGELLGYTMHPQATAFEDVQFILYVLNTNDVACAAEWGGHILWQMKDDANTPYELQLPVVPKDGARLDVWRGPATFAQGSFPSTTNVNLGFAEPRTVLTGYAPITSFHQAALSYFISYGGTIHGRLVKIGSGLVQVDIALAMWHDNADGVEFKELIKIPHVLLSGGDGEFSLPLNAPFGHTSTRDRGPTMAVCLVSGVVAPKDCSAPYRFMVYFDRVEFDTQLPPVIATRLQFLWASFSGFAPVVPEAPRTWMIPCRLSDYKVEGATLKMEAHPLARLVASAGMFQGTMRFILRWTFASSLTTPTTYVQLVHKFGTTTSSESYLTKLAHASQSTELSLDVVVAGLGGFMRSGVAESRENFIEISLSKPGDLAKLDIIIELLPGFRFRGPTITPLVRLT